MDIDKIDENKFETEIQMIVSYDKIDEIIDLIENLGYIEV